MLSVQARLLTNDKLSAAGGTVPVDAAYDAGALYADGRYGQSFLQSAFWADFKALHGWKPLRFELTVCSDAPSVRAALAAAADKAQSASFELSVLLRSFKRFFSIAYIPLGPGASLLELAQDELQSFWIRTAEAVKPFLPKNTLCLRFDPPLDFYSLDERDAFVRSISKPLVKSLADIQPPDTTVLDLTLSEDELSANMKPKWRYNIRLAEKKGVSVKACGEDGIDIFYALYEQTAKRDGIALHAKDYYRSLLRLAKSEGARSACTCTLYIAEHEGEALAAVIVLFWGKEAVYLYGASSNNKRNFMSAYLLQWTAIRDAKKALCTSYDFYGMPPTDDENHPMHGLYRFKTGFGGKIIHRPGSIDFPLSKLYAPFSFAEKLRLFYYKKIKKLFRR